MVSSREAAEADGGSVHQIPSLSWRNHNNTNADDDSVSLASEDEATELGITALVLGLLALTALVTLALKAFCERRKERKMSEEKIPRRIPTPPRRERLQSLSAGPHVFERH
jgi:hypothetical protein